MVKLSWVPKTLHCMCTNTQPFAAPLNWVQSWDGGVWLGRQVARRRARSPTVPTAVQSPKSGITGTRVSVPCFFEAVIHKSMLQSSLQTLFPFICFL